VDRIFVDRFSCGGAAVAPFLYWPKSLSEDDLTAIEAISDPRVLTELVTSLGRASSVLEARATLDHALARQDRTQQPATGSRGVEVP
jgi:hypothetical protein